MIVDYEIYPMDGWILLQWMKVMSLRVNSNTESLFAQGRLRHATRKKNSTSIQTSTGDRINKAANDPAGLGISEKLKASIVSFGQAERNANDAISLLQTAEGSFGEISNIGIRLRELSIQCASDTLHKEQRLAANKEFQGLKNEIQRFAQSSHYNNKKLLDGSGVQFLLQVGINKKQSENAFIYDTKNFNSTLNKLGISSTNVSNKYEAQNAISDISTMLNKVSEKRAKVGVMSLKVISAISNLGISRENHSSANSRVRDADIAKTTANQVALDIREKTALYSLKKANESKKAIMRLVDNTL